MDIGVEQLNGKGEPLPLRSDVAPWKEISSLRESRGEEIYLRKMTKALKKSLPRLKKSATQRWSKELWAISPWAELSASEALIHDFWKLSVQSPAEAESEAIFQEWISAREGQPATSLWEVWHLLSILLLQGAQLSDDCFWKIWNLGAEAFQQVQDDLDAPEGAEGKLDEFLIASVELRWLALAVYPEMEQASQLAKQARQSATSWCETCFPKIGKPDAEDLQRLPFVWRSLARSSSVCDLLGERQFRKSDAQAWRKLLSTTCRLAGNNGKLLVCEESLPWDFLSESAQKVTTPKQPGLRRLLQAYQKQQTTGNLTDNKKWEVPAKAPSLQLDDCEWAVLRSAWTPTADCCVVDHSLPELRLICQSGSFDLLSGVWDLEIVAGEKTYRPQEEWSATCWHSDADGDYLELQQQINDQFTVERQLFLSRSDHFLYLAEVVHAPDDCEWTLRSTLPFSDNLSAQQDQFTREWRLKQKKKIKARLFPLALDQEIIHKTDGTASSVESAEHQIVIERSAKGSLFMPMVIDWHPHHVAAPAEWRKLTITQSREISPLHEAGGYRLRMAEQHLMVYRSLVQPFSPRAVLGQHTLNESLIGKLDHEGDLQPLLIVE